jgi:putative SOS response-associated peptidase YedK
MLETCAILTTPPNAPVAEVHDRMPAILHEEDYDRCLIPESPTPSELKTASNHLIRNSWRNMR